MIRVTVELIPHGVGDPVVIGTAVISNDGLETRKTRGTYGAYDFSLWGRKRHLRSGHVVKFPRRSKNVWYLIARCLKEAGFDR